MLQLLQCAFESLSFLGRHRTNLKLYLAALRSISLADIAADPPPFIITD
jgi:hypothetical protein